MIKSTAPTRIDLAGGTLDIWPLYLLLGCPPTLNAAIDLYASVELKPRRDNIIQVESTDLKIKKQFSSLGALPQNHPLGLILKTLQFYKPKGGLDIVTDCQAPAGSGIGGSSALSIALNGALNRFVRSSHPKKQMIEIARNIETQAIKVPTGWQDYFPALYGGVQCLRPSEAGVVSENVPVDLEKLNRRFILCFTGKPRKSGLNNWVIMKKALDGNPDILKKLSRIARVTREMESALFRGQMEVIGKWFDEEWKARRTLAPDICTLEMNRLITLARKHGAVAAKTCGAGGGGCVAFFVHDGTKERISLELKNNGFNILQFRFVKRGLRVYKT